MLERVIPGGALSFACVLLLPSSSGPAKCCAGDHCHCTCQDVEKHVTVVKHAAWQKQLDAFVDHSDKPRRQYGQQAYKGNTMAVASALLQGFVHEQSHHTVFDEV